MKKILLVCNAGMSTSLLVQKMQKVVAEKNLDAQVEAQPLANAMDKIDDVDIVLLGPQVGFEKGNMEKDVNGRIPVDVIDMRDYGMMNAQKVLDKAFKTMEDFK
ncbi:MAG: PTS sugar transporter subunit IIB [Eubacteriaceae bacterium]|jgi:PTS system cellobiose-specific IIB component|nr:PTS sugar transporter subunit IIB [Eubacteriaceae bacterium]